MTLTEAAKGSNASTSSIASDQSTSSKSDTTFKHENPYNHRPTKDGHHPGENVPQVFVLPEKVGKKLIKEDGTLEECVVKHYGEPSHKSRFVGILPGKDAWDLWMQSFIADFGKGAVAMTGTDGVYLGTVHHRKFHIPTLLALQIRFNETKTKIDSVTVPSEENQPADHEMVRCMAMHLTENLLGKAGNEQQIDALQILVDEDNDNERLRSLPEDVRTQLSSRAVFAVKV